MDRVDSVDSVPRAVSATVEHMAKHLQACESRNRVAVHSVVGNVVHVVETWVHIHVQIAVLRREPGRRTSMSPTRPRSTAVCEECSMNKSVGLVATLSPAGR